jgi:hypothetical protein
MCSLNLISKYLDTTKMVTSKEEIVEFYLLFKRSIEVLFAVQTIVSA